MSVEKKEAVKEELSQYLTFILDNEEYAVPILKVSGIQGWEKTTPIPNAPEYVKGIINLRGEVVPIIDLRKRFNLEHREYDAHTVVIVVKMEQREKKRTVGLVVDAVADVYDIDREKINDTPDFNMKVNDDFVKGLGLIEDKMVIVLEIDNLVDWKNMSEDDAQRELEDLDSEDESSEEEAA